jgi:two-component system, sensor histidine kinase YesM
MRQTMVKNKTSNIGKFEHQLRKSVAKRVFLLLGTGISLFIIGLLIVTYSTNRINAVNNLMMLKDVYKTLYQKNETFLLNSNTINYSRNLINHIGGTEKLGYEFNKFNSSCKVKNQIILSDCQGKVLYTSYDSEELTHLQNYNSAICHNAKSSAEGTIYNSVFYSYGKYSDYIFVEPVYENKEVIGFISLYLSGDDWNYYLLNCNFDGVITDGMQNVIYASKPGLISQSNKFNGKDYGIYYYNKERFWVASEALPNYHVKIYSLIYYPKNSSYFFIGLTTIIVMGLCWFLLANWMANSMAKNNAELISKLASEIRIIQNGDYLHRIELGTQDEFSEVADRINHMLDNLSELNSRNTELLKLNNAMEINQLTVQMKPHFLYNTLEIIRNLVLIDGKRAEQLIVQLTHVLRYSINGSKEDVYLEEDMQYIQDYLAIQNCRFGDRLCCTVDIDEDCKSCIIPKLVLQPIIENSIKYGFKKKMNIKIDIRGFMSGNILILSIKDDGLGMPEKSAVLLSESLGEIYPRSGSYGLHHISRWLYLRYGSKSGIEIRNCEGVGFEVVLKVMQSMEG